VETEQAETVEVCGSTNEDGSEEPNVDLGTSCSEV